jgi:hypothetical protein
MFRGFKSVSGSALFFKTEPDPDPNFGQDQTTLPKWIRFLFFFFFFSSFQFLGYFMLFGEGGGIVPRYLKFKYFLHKF